VTSPEREPAPVAGNLFAGLDLENRKTVIAAVSGGSDSLALLDLAATALAGGPTDLVVVTVDHGLRREAAAEARQVAAIAADLGLRHLTLRWKEPDAAAGGLIARAREARYRLIAQAADEIGTDLVLLGHTADDQAETVAMRAARKADDAESWNRGGAGMARATLFDGRIWLARPLLGIRRVALRAHLAARGLAWIDDPTNLDTRYERPRIRARLDDPAPLLKIADDATHLRAEMGGRAARLIVRHATMPAPGLLRLDPEMLQEDDRQAALYALRCLLAVAGGREHLPDHARSCALLARLDENGLCATLSRTRVEVRRQGIFLVREKRDLPRLEARPGIIWDGRHRLSANGLRPGAMVAPMGDEAARASSAIHADLPERLVRIALSAEPRLSDGERSQGTPGGTFERCVAPFARYLGEYDLELAAALARVIGAPLPPPSPFAGHNGG
jgi:tRNA(Ile)-lysidine synthase